MKNRVLRVGLAATAAAAVSLAFGGPARHPPSHRLLVGGVEDDAEWSTPLEKMELARFASFRVIVLSSVWTPPQVSPDRPAIRRLRKAVSTALSQGIRPVIAVYSFGRDTPLTPRARHEFSSYAEAVLDAIPRLRFISIGNEPNSNLFWAPQFGPRGSDAAAVSYFQLLSEAYDVLKTSHPSVTVIGGSLAARGSDNPHAGRPEHSPTRFIEDLGSAFRASGRRRPIMDMFSLHPYPKNSSVPPNVAHPHSTTIGIADYDRLSGLLQGAFRRPLPIVYGEYGIESRIPRAELGLYTGAEGPAVRPVDERAQAADYVEAIHLAACQPLVRMIMFFHVTDETRFTGLQTGLFYPNDMPKRSLDTVAAAAEAAEGGQVKCPG